MGFLNNLLHGPAVLAMKNAEPETPTIMDSMPEAISWPTDAEFAGYANGMYCREYAVRVVVDFISRQLASLPLKVYRKNADGDAEEVRDGALAKLIRHPSDLPGMSRYRFYATLIRDMLLEDRWLCTLGSNRAGDGNTLRRIPPDGYSLTANGFGELTGVTISSVAENKGGTYRLPDPRIVLDIGYIDGLNLGDPITDVLRPLLAEARVMAKYRKSIAENGYQIPAYVYRPKEMPWESQADYDDFTQGLRNYVAGGGMAGTWPVFKDGMVHVKGTATDWATILVTQDLPAGEYTLEHTLVDGVGPFCELKSTDGRIDLFSHGTVKATLPAGDYRMIVSVSPGKTVDATITPILRKLN